MEKIDNLVRNHLLNVFPIFYGKSSIVNANKNIVDYIYQLITSTKFRKSSLDVNSGENIRDKITAKINAGLPIEFSFPFGGVKNWRLSTFPDVDWSEVFCLLHLSNYLKRISDFYPPGVILYFNSGDAIMNIANNVPEECTSRYLQCFKSLLEIVNRNTPQNLQFKLVRTKELYDNYSDFKNELNKNIEDSFLTWSEKYTSEYKEYLYLCAKRNLMVKGIRNLSLLSEKELEMEWKKAAIINDAYLCLTRRRKFNKLGDRIQLVNLKGPNLSLHIGSTNASSVQFWAGSGVIEVRMLQLLHFVYSYESLNKARLHNINIMDSQFKGISNNFNSIKINISCAS